MKKCPNNCPVQLRPQAKFCSHCGSPLIATVQSDDPQNIIDNYENLPESQILEGCCHRMEYILKHLEARYLAQGFQVQILGLQDEGDVATGKVLQVKKTGVMRALTGLLSAGTVVLKPKGDDLEYSVFGGQWVDKAIVGGIAMFVTLGVLILPASYGAWAQKNLLEELEQDIKFYAADGRKVDVQNIPKLGHPNSRPAISQIVKDHITDRSKGIFVHPNLKLDDISSLIQKISGNLNLEIDVEDVKVHIPAAKLLLTTEELIIDLPRDRTDVYHLENISNVRQRYSSLMYELFILEKIPSIVDTIRLDCRQSPISQMLSDILVTKLHQDVPISEIIARLQEQAGVTFYPEKVLESMKSRNFVIRTLFTASFKKPLEELINWVKDKLQVDVDYKNIILYMPALIHLNGLRSGLMITETQLIYVNKTIIVSFDISQIVNARSDGKWLEIAIEGELIRSKLYQGLLKHHVEFFFDIFDNY